MKMLYLKKINNGVTFFHEMISKLFLYLSMGFIATMTLGILVQVVMRYVVGRPIAWIEEYCVYSMFLVAFLMGPYLFFYKSNICMTLFYDKLQNDVKKLCVDIILNIAMILGVLFILPNLLDIVMSNMNVSNTQIPISKGQMYTIAPISFFLIMTISFQHIVSDIISFVETRKGVVK